MLIYAVLQLDCKSHFTHLYTHIFIPWMKQWRPLAILCPATTILQGSQKAELVPMLNKFSRYHVTANSPLHSSHHPSCYRLRSENPSLRSCRMLYSCHALTSRILVMHSGPSRPNTTSKWEPQATYKKKPNKKGKKRSMKIGRYCAKSNFLVLDS